MTQKTKIDYTLKPIGFVHSNLTTTAEAPLFYNEGAPEATVKVSPEFAAGLHRIEAGTEIIIITWLHQGDRSVLQVHPRNQLSNPLTGVFLTGSPDRPNPLGLHRATVLEIDGTKLRIDAIEAIDGTPVVDIKPVVGSNDH